MKRLKKMIMIMMALHDSKRKSGRFSGVSQYGNVIKGDEEN